MPRGRVLGVLVAGGVLAWVPMAQAQVDGPAALPAAPTATTLPHLGAPPVRCFQYGSSVNICKPGPYAPNSDFLDSTYYGQVDISPHLARAGETMTATEVPNNGGTPSWPGPQGIPGTVLSGCKNQVTDRAGKVLTPASTSCVWRTRAVTGAFPPDSHADGHGWSSFDMGFVGFFGLGSSEDYYYVQPKSSGISGTVDDSEGRPIAGAVVHIAGAQSGTAVTFADGTYSVFVAPGTYTVSVGGSAASGLVPTTCSPGSATGAACVVSVEQSDGVASFGARYSVSGTVTTVTCTSVTCTSQPAPGVTVQAKGAKTAAAISDAQGNYSIPLPAGSYTVAPQTTGTWQPPSQTVTLAPDATQVDFTNCKTPPPRLAPHAATTNQCIDYTWTMPPRFNQTGEPTGKTPADFDPDHFSVEFNVDDGDCAATGTYQWLVDDQPVTAAQTGCKFTVPSPAQTQGPFPFTKQGTYSVSVSYQATPGGATTRFTDNVLVRDFLIASLGDSAASGEGVAGAGGWANAQCHRATHAFPSVTAEAIENDDPHSSVTFVHLACSGATIPTGLTGGYVGIEPKQGQRLPPQLAELKRLVGDREIDALQISIGINDAKFSAVISHCAIFAHCWSTHYDPGNPLSAPTHFPLMTVEQKRLFAGLPGRYASLDAALVRIFPRSQLEPSHVYLTEYPDPLHQSNGTTFCNPFIPLSPRPLPGARDLQFTQKEAEQGYDDFLVPLRQAGAAAARKYGWTFVTGAANALVTHGYCTANPWFVTIPKAYFNKNSPKNLDGPVHPTAEGHKVWADAVLTPAFEADLLPGGTPRAPAS